MMAADSKTETTSRLAQIQSPEIQSAIAEGRDFRIDTPPTSEKDPRYDGCRCFMRVVGVENTPIDFGGQTWGLFGATVQTAEFTGEGEGESATWVLGSDRFPLPSEFKELDPLNPNGSAEFDGIYTHMFYMSSYVPNAPGYRINSQVVCYSAHKDGTLTEATNIPYTFEWENGGTLIPGFLSLRRFFEEFSCLYISQEPKLPRSTP